MTKKAPPKDCAHCGKSTGLGARFRYCSPACQLWAGVDIGGPDDCWLWRGAKNSMGYGQLRTGGAVGKTMYAHRLAFELANGPIGSAYVCHRCDTPLCCNPKHHFLGSQADNVRDMHQKGRARGGSPPGDACWNSKLDEQRVREIRDLCTSGVSQYEAARRYGVSQPTVGSIMKRRTWKHMA